MQVHDGEVGAAARLHLLVRVQPHQQEVTVSLGGLGDRSGASRGGRCAIRREVTSSMCRPNVRVLGDQGKVGAACMRRDMKKV